MYKIDNKIYIFINSNELNFLRIHIIAFVTITIIQNNNRKYENEKKLQLLSTYNYTK